MNRWKDFKKKLFFTLHAVNALKYGVPTFANNYMS